MTEFKQLVYTDTADGTRVLGKSDGFPATVEGAVSGLYGTFSVSDEIKNAALSGNGIPTAPCRYKYTVIGGNSVIVKTEYVGKGVSLSDKAENYFMQVYAGETELCSAPALYFSREGAFSRKEDAGRISGALPLRELEADVDGALKAALEVVGDVAGRETVSALVEDVLDAISSDKRLVFVRCGEGARLIKLITAISLMLPKDVALRMTFDTALSPTGDGMPEQFKMTDVITGFADGISDGGFEKCKHHAYTYKVYDMSDIASWFKSGGGDSASSIAEKLFSDRVTAYYKLPLYHGIVDREREKSVLERMTASADTVEKLIALTEPMAEKAALVYSACEREEADTVSEELEDMVTAASKKGMEACFELLEIVSAWDGVSELLPDIIERACFDGEYLNDLCRRIVSGDTGATAEIDRFKTYGAYDRLIERLSDGVADYTEDNAERIAEGVLNADEKEKDRFKNLCSYGGDKARELAEAAISACFLKQVDALAGQLMDGDGAEAERIFGVISSVCSERSVGECSAQLSKVLKVKMAEKADELVSGYLGDTYDSTALLLEGVYRRSAECKSLVGEAILRRLESDPTLSDDIRDRLIEGDAADVKLSRLEGYVSEEKLSSSIAASFGRYLDNALDDTVLLILSGDAKGERIYGEIAGRCPDQLPRIKEGLRKAYTENVVTLADEMLRGEFTTAERYVSAMKRYVPVETGEDVYGNALNDELKARMLQMSPELIGKIAGGDGEAFEGLPIADSEYGSSCREVLVGALGDWLSSEEGGQYLTALSGELFDAHDEAVKKIIALEKYVTQICGDEYLRMKFRAVAKERCGELAAALFAEEPTAIENYRTVGVYGGVEEQRGVLDSFMSLCDGEYRKNAEDLYLGEDSTVCKRIKTLDTCDIMGEYSGKYRAAFEAAVMEYVLENGGERLTALAMKKIDGDEEQVKGIELILSKYAIEIRPKLTERIGEIAREEYSSLESGLAGDGYVAVYERLCRFCKYTNEIDERSCVIGGLGIYFGSEEYKKGFASYSESVALKLGFFFESEYEEVRHTVKDALLNSFTEPERLFAYETVYEAYERLRGAFKEILTAYECFMAVLEYYKAKSPGDKRQAMLADFVTEFIKRAKKQIHDVGGDLEAYESVCGSEYGKSVLEDIFRFELRRVDNYSGVERLLGIYDTVSRRRATELINALDNQYKRDMLLGDVFKTADDDIVKKFNEYLSSSDSGLAEEYYARYAQSKLTCYAKLRLLTETQADVSSLILRELNENGFWDKLCMDGILPYKEAFSMLLRLLGKLKREEDRNALLGQYVRTYGIRTVDAAKLMTVSGYALKQGRKTEGDTDIPYFYRLVRFYDALMGKEQIPESEYQKVFSASAAYDRRDALRTLKATVIYMIAMGRIGERHFDSLAAQFMRMEYGGHYVGRGTFAKEQIAFLLSGLYTEKLAAPAALKAFGRYFGVDGTEEFKSGWEPVLNEYMRSRVFDGYVAPIKLFVDICGAASQRTREQLGMEVKPLKKLDPSAIDHISTDIKYTAGAIVCTEVSARDQDKKGFNDVILRILDLARQDPGYMKETVRNYGEAISNKKGAVISVPNHCSEAGGAAMELKRCLARRLALACVNGKLKNCSLSDIHRYFGVEFTEALAEFIFRSVKIRDQRCLKLLARAESGVYLEKLKCGLGDLSCLNSGAQNTVLKTLVSKK